MNEASLVAAHTAGYEVYKVGWAIGLIETAGAGVKYFKITNTEAIPWLENSASTWWSSLGTDTSNNIGDISDWLEPGENVLYAVKNRGPLTSRLD